MHSVVFDMMGVLYTEGHYISGLFNDWFGDKISLEELSRVYIQFAVGEISRDEFWKHLTSEPDKYEREFFDLMQPMPDLDVIRDLKGKCCLGLLTEMPAEWIGRMLDKAHLADFFDVKVVSGIDKLNKPDTAIYELLLSRLPEGGKKIFVDDRLKNLAPAAELGFITILMQGPKLKPQPFKPEHVVQNLADARKIIGRILAE